MRIALHRRGRTLAWLLTAALLTSLWLAVPRVSASAEILRVGEGQAFADIQSAVDAASPGDLILVHPGRYDGDVTIPPDKPDLTIRGLDRNEVILDGRDEQRNAITALADNTVMENMTARNFTGNGFYWRSMSGYEGRYLTTYRVGLYGIYAFDATDGIFEHSYASGSGDASFYIGNCRPCNAVITDVIAEHSALGYSGTNAGGNLVIKDSVWRLNGAGIVPNSLDSQDDPPQRSGSTIEGNLIEQNGNPDVPGFGIAGAIHGHGVGIAGGNDNIVQDNVIRDNAGYGVVIFPIPGGEKVYLPNDNVVHRNTFEGNGGADLALAAGSGVDNCFANNEHTTSAPAGLEETHPCRDDSALLKKVPVYGDPAVTVLLAEDFLAAETGTNHRIPYTDTPIPPDQPTMPSPDPEQGDGEE